MRKRTKLLLAASAMAGATALAVSNIPASAAGQGQNFVVISNHPSGVKKILAEIEEHAADGSVLQKVDPSSGSAFRYIDSNTKHITVRRAKQVVKSSAQNLRALVAGSMTC